VGTARTHRAESILRACARTRAGAVAATCCALVACSMETTSSPRASSASASSSCASLAADLEKLPQLKDFELYVDDRLTTYPWHGLPQVAPPAFVTHFKSERFIGFLSSVALSGAYRQDEDQQARALGYPIGKWPYVPLEGKVVAGVPGVLEVYVYVYHFWQSSDATAFLDFARTDNLDPSYHSTSAIPGFVGFAHVFGPDDGQHEHIVTMMDTQGPAAVMLQFQGGAAFTSRSVDSEAEAAAVAASPCAAGSNE
jgi:hypothetical protein